MLPASEPAAALRARCWPALEAAFGRLPPHLFRQGVALRHALAQTYSATGQFVDLLARPEDPPWLALTAWAVAAWPGPETEALAPRLYVALAALTCVAGARTLELEARPELEAALRAEAAAQLALSFPPEAPFWGDYTRWLAVWEAAGTEEAATGPRAEADLPRLAARFAFAQVALTAAAHAAGQAGTPRLAGAHAVLETVCAGWAGLAEALAFRRDAERGTRSTLIQRVMHAAGAVDLTPWPAARLMGALFLTGTLTTLAEEWRARLAEAGRQAEALGLPGLATAASALAGQYQAVAGLWRGQATALHFLPAGRTPAEAAMLAERALLADRPWPESWEVQRRGLFGEPELIGRVFAPGLVLEVLGRAGHALPAEVDAVLGEYAANDFRYFPHPAVPPDADDLGLALRLLAHAGGPALHRAALQRPLRWLRANVLADGGLPCWLTREVEALDTRAGAGLWGNRCATVEAHLLLGLLAAGEGAELIAPAGRRWLAQWEARGLGATEFYDKGFALWAAARLLGALAAAQLGLDTAAATQALGEHVRDTAAQPLTPQTAALLALTCLDPQAPAECRGLFNPAWLTSLPTQQRYDGTWAAEPVYISGEVAVWYASRTVTTAVCYLALKWGADSFR